MMRTKLVFVGWAAALAGGQATHAGCDGDCRVVPAPVVAGAQAEVQPLIDHHLADEQAKVIEKLAAGEAWPARHKLPVRIKGVRDPWGAMADLERFGLRGASAVAQQPLDIGDVLDRLSRAMGRRPGTAEVAQEPLPVETILERWCRAIAEPVGASGQIAPSEIPSLDGHVEHLITCFDRAKELRDGALGKLGAEDRKAMFSWVANLMGYFGPQLPLRKETRTLLHNDRNFCRIVWQHYDWEKLLAAAKCLAGLASEANIEQLKQVLEHAPPAETSIDGVTGEILFAKETPHGWIIFGGVEANAYELSQPVAIIVDLGGDDVYRGTVATSCDADRANQVVIDLAGNDRYEGNRRGLACGRLGVGILYDLAGDDHYELAPGSGGTGFGGIGVLCDAAGNDTYVGSKFTQGAAIAGIGLLLDCQGDDRYTSFAYSIGLGGPAGVGAVIDGAGNDFYQCGHKYPSSYNKGDATPDDPQYQYTAFGMGTGLGRRIFSKKADDHDYALAGGLGMLLDMAGNDQYESSNFSQACGYYFGVGLKMDLAGDDRHKAARYGCASGAHFGMALFVDYCGEDTYQSTGPTYNGGCSWDHTASLFVDAGTAKDAYCWDNSHGPARTDIGSWGTFVELGGDDCYRLRTGLGRTTRTSMAIFYDRSGTDDYQLTERPEQFTPADGTSYSQDPGGLFVDK